MEIINIQVIRPQNLQRLLQLNMNRLHRIRRSTFKPTDLGRDNDGITRNFLQKFADDPLRVSVAIHIRRVQMIDSQFVSSAQAGKRFVIIVAGPSYRISIPQAGPPIAQQPRLTSLTRKPERPNTRYSMENNTSIKIDLLSFRSFSGLLQAPFGFFINIGRQGALKGDSQVFGKMLRILRAHNGCRHIRMAESKA
jgi:hypothetical protein